MKLAGTASVANGAKRVGPRGEPASFDGRDVTLLGQSLGAGARVGKRLQLKRPGGAVCLNSRVQQRELTAKRPPDFRRFGHIEVEQAQCLAVDALQNAVRHRQQVAGLVEGEEAWGADACGACPGDRDRLFMQGGEVRRMDARDAQHPGVAQQIDRVEDACIGQVGEGVNGEAVARGDGAKHVRCDLGMRG